MSADLLRRAAGKASAMAALAEGLRADTDAAVAGWLDYCASYRDGVDPGSYASAVMVARAYLGASE